MLVAGERGPRAELLADVDAARRGAVAMVSYAVIAFAVAVFLPRVWAATRSTTVIVASTANCAAILLVCWFGARSLRRGAALSRAAHTLAGAVFFGCAFAQVFNGGFASPYVAGITVCPLLATFIGGVRMGLGWAGAAVALQLGIYVALHAGAELPRAIGDPDFDRSAAIAQALILGVITALAVSSELSKQAAMSRAEELGRSLERARTEVTSARIESEAAVSMSAVRSRFLATMSHELRTPLNAILGYAELAREEVRDSGALVSHQELDQILTAGQHLLALLNDILETSAIEASRIELRPAPCRLADVVDGVEAILGPLARRQGLRLIVTVDDPGGEVWLDPVRLRQILLNLGSNAIKFTSQGEVYVAASRRPVGGLSEIDLVVRDTGIGIAPADQERIFDAFVQVDASRARRYDGAGLGLSITRALVKLMGGTLTLTSALGAGTTIRVRCTAPHPAARVNEPDGAPTV